MMLHGILGKRIASTIICAAMLLTINPTVLAAESHEDPEIAKPIFSGISLFRYYSNALDFVLQKEPTAVTARLAKMPYANVPERLVETSNRFATSSIDISHRVVEIAEDLNKLLVLRGQFRIDEAIHLGEQISDNLSVANTELLRIKQAILTTGEELRVFSTPEGSDLRQSYYEVLDRIDKIRKMLNLYEELLKSTGLTAENLLKSTVLTLEIQLSVVFVGDNISFEGVLTSDSRPLVGREVAIILNGSQYMTAYTDANGHYQGRLMVPYLYLPELNVQALYYPRDKDIGLYLASLSPVKKIKILFYQAKLKLMLKDKAYPGRDTMVAGKFDYAELPPLSERKIEIYIDDVVIAEVTVQEVFTQQINIAPNIDLGKHFVTVSSAAKDRYSPVVAGAMLEITRAIPILELKIPKVAIIPGSIGLQGRLYSEVGPLSKASVKIGLSKSQVELKSAEDGILETKIKTEMGLGLIGSQDLVIQVLPSEPWHTTLATTRSVLMVNVINLSGILILLIILGIYLPGKLKGKRGAYLGRVVKPEMIETPSELTPRYSDKVIIPATIESSTGPTGEPRDRIFYWYLLAVRLLEKLTKVLFAPQQTLREFAKENSGLFGPLAKYFTELTKTVERLLYSKYVATEQDAENSKQLSQRIEMETKLQIAMQPMVSEEFSGVQRSGNDNSV